MQRRSTRFVLLPLSILPAAAAVTFLAVPTVFAALRAQASAPAHFFGITLVLNLVGLGLFVLIVLASVPVLRQDADDTNPFVSALVATSALIPLTVTELVTVASYIAPASGFPSWIHWIRDLALFWGAAAGVVAWALVAFLYRNVATVTRQNARVYGDLCQQYAQIRSRLIPYIDTNDLSKSKSAAYREAQLHLRYVAAELNLEWDGRPKTTSPRPALRWVLATGYINLWNRLHRAEEAVIVLEGPEAVVSDAVYDYMRVQGSSIPARDQLLAKINWAVTAIAPADAERLTPITVAPAAGGAVKVQFVPQSKPFRLFGFTLGSKKAPVADAKEQAQLVLREVRRAIDEYRDNSWDELVRQRNHLVETMIILRVSAFLLLGVAVIVKVPVHTVVAVTVYYLVGASIGLFNRLYAQPTPQESQPVEDYGLTSTTLLQAPLFAGLAAVGGVIITGILTVSLTKVLAPNAHETVMQLAAILDIVQNKIGIVIAAIFGLTPQLLLNRLLQISQQYKTAIGNSEPSQVKGSSGPS